MSIYSAIVVVALVAGLCHGAIKNANSTTFLDHPPDQTSYLSYYVSEFQETIMMRVTFYDKKMIKVVEHNASRYHDHTINIHDYKQAIDVIKDITIGLCFMKGFDKTEYPEDYWAIKQRYGSLSTPLIHEPPTILWKKGKRLDGCVMQSLSQEGHELCDGWPTFWLNPSPEAFDISGQPPVNATTALQLKWLPSEVLAGVLQRVRPFWRIQVELVDRRLAALTRTHAWIHSHCLSIDTSKGRPCIRWPLGAHGAKAKLAPNPNQAATTVMRAILARTLVKAVRFVNMCSWTTELDSSGQLARVLASLAESPRVRLTALDLSCNGCRCAACRAFAASPEVARLILRHSYTLIDIALSFHDSVSHQVLDAVAACAGLRHVCAHLDSHSACQQLAAVIDRKRVRSLTLRGGASDYFRLVGVPPSPTLEALQLRFIHFHLDCLLRSNPEAFIHLREFASVGILGCDLGTRPLLLPLLRACPLLELLYVQTCRGAFADLPSVRALPAVYFAMGKSAVEHTLSARLAMTLTDRRYFASFDRQSELAGLMSAWQAETTDLRIECFDADVCRVAGLSTADDPPTRPRAWATSGYHFPHCAVFRMRRQGGKRWLLLWLYVQVL